MLQKIFSYALFILAKKDYSVVEMQKKICQKFPESTKEEQNAIVEELKKQNFLDDKRFAENFVRYKTEYGGKGKRCIETELRQKGIFDTKNVEALQNFDEEREKELALSLVKRKFSGVEMPVESVETQKQKAKIFRFLAGRGFSSSIITSILDDFF